jgi:hypothetical protein
MYASHGSAMDTAGGSTVAAQWAPRPIATVADSPGHSIHVAQLRGWIALLLGRRQDDDAIAISGGAGYMDVAGNRCANDAPPLLRLASRLARFERQRLAVAACEGRVDGDHLHKRLQECGVQLRDDAWAVGGHYREMGIRPDDISRTLARAVDRTLQLVAVADRPAASALRRELVRRGLQGYHATQLPL